MTAEEFIERAHTLAMVDGMFTDFEMDREDVLTELGRLDFPEDEAEALVVAVQRDIAEVQRED